MYDIKQGDILKIENIKHPVLVVSNNFFNKTESVVVCPIVENTDQSPIHLAIEYDKKQMYVLTEQLKYLNLKTRGYSIKEHNDYDSIFEVIDTIQSIFEYED